jgi:hypothetical protein
MKVKAIACNIAKMAGGRLSLENWNNMVLLMILSSVRRQ